MTFPHAVIEGVGAGAGQDYTADLQAALDSMPERGGRVVVRGHVNLSEVEVKLLAPNGKKRSGVVVDVEPGSYIGHVGSGVLFTVRSDRFMYFGGKSRIHGEYAGTAFHFDRASYGGVQDAWITGHDTAIHLSDHSQNNAFERIKAGALRGPAVVIEGVSNDNRFYTSQYGEGGGCTQNLIIDDSRGNDFNVSMGGGLIGEDQVRVILRAGAGANYFTGRLEQDPGIKLVRAEAGSHENDFYRVPGLTYDTAAQWVDDFGTDNEIPV